MTITRSVPIRWILGYFAVSFVFHAIWEKSQMGLYAMEMSEWDCWVVCLRATATGDMAFMATIYLALAAVHRDWGWIMRSTAYRHPATWVITVIVGSLLAVSCELWAVHVVHRWAYAPSMPLLPFLQVGLTPVLQMILIPIAVLLVFAWIAKHRISAAQ
jgi:hypothetical protein